MNVHYHVFQRYNPNPRTPRVFPGRKRCANNNEIPVTGPLSSVTGHNRVIKVIWTLFCITGMITHHVFITIQYSRYPVTSEVTVGYVEKFRPPAISLCFSIVEIRKVGIFHQNNPCGKKLGFRSNNAEYADCLKHMTGNYSVAEIFDDLTMNILDYITLIEVSDYGGYSNDSDRRS